MNNFLNKKDRNPVTVIHKATKISVTKPNKSLQGMKLINLVQGVKLIMEVLLNTSMDDNLK